MIGVIDYFEKLARLMTDRPITVTIEGTEASCTISQNKITLPSDIIKDSRYHGQAYGKYIRELSQKYDADPVLFRAWLMTMLGYHEISHILFTPVDFGGIAQDALARSGLKLNEANIKILMDLHNFMEDRRIEHELSQEFPFIRHKLDLMNRVLLTSLEIPPGLKGVSVPTMLDLASVVPQVSQMMVATVIMASASHYMDVKTDLAKIDIEHPVSRRICQIMADIDGTAGKIAHDQAVSWAIEVLKLLNLPEPDQENQVPKGTPKRADQGQKSEEKTEGQKTEGQGEGQGKSGKEPSQADKEKLKEETEGRNGQGEEEGDNEEEGQGEPGNEEGEGSKGQPMTVHRHVFGDRPPTDPGERLALAEELTKEMHDFQAELANAKLQADILRTTGVNADTYKLIKPDLVRKLEGQLSRLVKSLRSKKETVDYDGHSMDCEQICQIKARPSSLGETKLYQSSQKDKADFHIVFCVDQSGSMSGYEGIRANTRQLVANQVTVNLCHALDKVQIKTDVIYFTDKARLIKDSTVKTISSPIGEQEAGGENEICMAVKLAHDRLKKSQADRKAVIVLTDGGDNTYEETGRLIRANPSVEHYFVWIFSNDMFLKQMQSSTGSKVNGSVMINRLEEMGPGTEELVKKFLARTKLVRGG